MMELSVEDFNAREEKYEPPFPFVITRTWRGKGKTVGEEKKVYEWHNNFINYFSVMDLLDLHNKKETWEATAVYFDGRREVMNDNKDTLGSNDFIQLGTGQLQEIVVQRINPKAKK